MTKTNTTPDVVLIGAGIMSATLGMLIKQLEPNTTIEIYERLNIAAAESSDAWNNAGTGHSAFCELNYTPEKADGSIEIDKAIKIAESFEISKQFWAYLIEHKIIDVPGSFIRTVPHMSFLWGDKNVDYLRKRHEVLTQCHLFRQMKYSEDRQQLTKWMPLVMQGRKDNEKLAATYMPLGTDVNFGNLTRCLFQCLQKREGVTIHFNHEVKTLKKVEDKWSIKVKECDTGKKRWLQAKFVFIGAGGGALPLLLKSGIKEAKGFGGFPVSGQWLKCKNREEIEKHDAKVYGKAPVGSPPMSVPHLDTRIIKGKKELLFGPYAGFTTKFLKKGSFLDLILSIRLNNIRPMILAGLHNIPLTKYLIQQVRQTPRERLDALKEFVPTAKLEDWELETAGQRVQVIKKDEKEGGILEFGTEVVSEADGSIAALLGASPGASTAVSIMLALMKKCFKEKMEQERWQQKLKEMIPSLGQSLGEDAELCESIRAWTNKVLGLNDNVRMNADAGYGMQDR
ncbi:MAG: malate:quinone oxidoreductase [Chitinophagaceae bacterium]|nr:malate:quinone oxidoreductase [Chitinophagaceae bacterium]